MYQIHDGSLRQPAVCVRKKPEDERHADSWRNRGVCRIALQPAQHARKRFYRCSAEVVGQLLAQLPERPEHAQLAEHHPQIERVLGAGYSDQGFQVRLVEFLQVPFQVSGHQLLAIVDGLESAALVDCDVAASPMCE